MVSFPIYISDEIGYVEFWQLIEKGGKWQRVMREVHPLDMYFQGGVFEN